MVSETRSLPRAKQTRSAESSAQSSTSLPKQRKTVRGKKRSSPKLPTNNHDRFVSDDARSIRGTQSTSKLKQEVVTLNAVPLGADGRTAPQILNLPHDVQSLLVEVRGQDDQAYVVDSLVGPTNDKLISPSAIGEGMLDGPHRSKNPATQVMLGSCAMMAPNNPGVQLTGGTWNVCARGETLEGAPGVGTVDLRITIVRGRPKSTGRLPLNLYFTSDRPGFRAEDAKQSPMFQTALKRMEEIYATAGIKVGPIRFETVGAIPTADGRARTAATVDSMGGDGPTPEELLRTSRNTDGVNVFITEGVYLDIGQVSGVSGSLPGPASPGTTSSGVIFSINDSLLSDNSTYGPVLGGLMAHEVGHYLGLPHTVEKDGEEDRFPDTESTREGAGNVMYWDEIRIDRNFGFTQQQAEVMKLHPLVQ